MSKITKTELLDVLAKCARKMCPVMPTQDLKAFGSGKLVGRAEGVAILFQDLVGSELLTDDEYLTLQCLLSNRDKEEVLEERKAYEELQENIAKMEEGTLEAKEQE